MNVIYKYPLNRGMTVSHTMPKGAKILTVGLQQQEIMLWALVKVEHSDHEGPKETRTFRIYGTGYPVQDETKVEYIGTLYDGPFVWHVFEIL